MASAVQLSSMIQEKTFGCLFCFLSFSDTLGHLASIVFMVIAHKETLARFPPDGPAHGQSLHQAMTIDKCQGCTYVFSVHANSIHLYTLSLSLSLYIYKFIYIRPPGAPLPQGEGLTCAGSLVLAAPCCDAIFTLLGRQGTKGPNKGTSPRKAEPRWARRPQRNPASCLNHRVKRSWLLDHRFSFLLH